MLIHIGAMTIVVLLPLAWGWRALLLMLLAVSLADGIWQTAWRRGRRAVTAIHLDGDGNVELRIGQQGRWQNVRLAQRTVLSPCLLLVWRPVNGRWWRSLIVPADATTADGFRRLRVALRRKPLSG